METIYDFVLNHQIDLAEISLRRVDTFEKIDHAISVVSKTNVSAFHFERMCFETKQNFKGFFKVIKQPKNKMNHFID